MKRTWKPTVAGIINIATAVFTLGYVVAASIGYNSLNPFLFLPFAIPPLIGGICAIRRRAWVVSLVCSFLSSPPGLVSLVLLILSQEEFKKRSPKS